MMVIVAMIVVLPVAFFPWDQSATFFSPAYAKVRAETQYIHVPAKFPRRVKIKVLVLDAILAGLVFLF